MQAPPGDEGTHLALPLCRITWELLCTTSAASSALSALAACVATAWGHQPTRAPAPARTEAPSWQSQLWALPLPCSSTSPQPTQGSLPAAGDGLVQAAMGWGRSWCLSLGLLGKRSLWAAGTREGMTPYQPCSVLTTTCSKDLGDSLPPTSLGTAADQGRETAPSVHEPVPGSETCCFLLQLQR